MRQMVSVSLMAVLLVVAFGAGYLARSTFHTDGVQAFAQSQSPQPSPAQSPGRSKAGSGKGSVTGVIQNAAANTLTITVQGARGTSFQQGSPLTVDLGPSVRVTREISAADLKKGDTVVIRGSVDGNRFVAAMIMVEKK